MLFISRAVHLIYHLLYCISLKWLCSRGLTNSRAALSSYIRSRMEPPHHKTQRALSCMCQLCAHNEKRNEIKPRCSMVFKIIHYPIHPGRHTDKVSTPAYQINENKIDVCFKFNLHNFFFVIVFWERFYSSISSNIFSPKYSCLAGPPRTLG